MKKTLVTRLLAILVCVAMLATVTPIFAAAETTITEIKITNADATPYIGEKVGDWLDYTLPENCHFTVALHYWYNETAGSTMKADGVFAAGSIYDLCWCCEAESGYTFDAGATVTINGSTTLLDDSYTKVDGSDPTLFFVWTKPTEAVENTVINKIKITNADVTPYIGEKAGDWLDYTLPENCHFTMAKHYWHNETANRSMTSEDVFAAGLEYDLCWVFKADSGYTFSAGTTVTINGETDIVDTVWTEIDDEDNTIFYVWTKPTEAVENTVINKIKITNADVTPYIGENTGDWLDYTLPENCHFTVDDHFWYNEAVGRSMTSEDVFAAGLEYDLCWTFKADSGYTFSDEAAVTLNGSTALLDSYTSVDTDDPTLFYVWTKPTEAVEKTATVIDKIEILDADVTPYIGEKAGDWSDYTLPANCHYTAVREYWHREGTDSGEVLSDDVFEEGVRYDRYWYFKADEGYIFDENAVITINGSTALVDTFFSRYYENEFSVWTKPTEAVENTVINKIEITDVDVLPIIGEKTNDHIDYTFSENCHFTAAEHGWYDKTDRVWVDGADDTFVAGHIYQVGWWLDADEGYTFAEDPTITINGGENINWGDTYIDEVNSMRFYVWTESKEAVEPIVINKIEINGFCDPVVGGKAGDYFHLTLPEDAPYYFDYSYWYNDTDDYALSSGDTFEAGKKYSLGGGLIADEGYVFAEDPEVLFNGGEYPVDESWTKRNGIDEGYFYVWGESKEAVEPIVIDKIEINDADVTPYIGGKAENYLYYTLPDNCHYSMETNLWYNEGTGNYLPGTETAFASGNTYTHAWNLVAEEGYIFAENATVTVNESSALVDTTWTKRSDDGTMFEVWTLPSLATAPTVIDKIEIDGFCDAVVGGKAGDYNHITLPEDAPYQFVPNFPLWNNDTDKVLLDNSDTFETGKSYSLGGWLAANKGYIFAEDAEVLLNGGEYPVDETNTERDESLNYGGYVFYVWSEPKEAVAAHVIDKIEINGFCDAVVGGKAGDFIHLTLPEDAPYHIKEDSPSWEHNNGASLKDDDVFEAGKSYTLGFTLIADAGYIFAEDAGVFLNGGDVGVDEKYTRIDIDDAGIFYVWSEPKEAVEPTEKLLGDANDDGAVNMKDVLMLRKQLAGMSPEINMTNADCNGDGDVNMKDVLMLRKFLAGLITELGA